MAAKSALIRQWAVKEKGKTTHYWMTFDRRSEATQQGIPIPGPARYLDNQLTHQIYRGVSADNHGLDVVEPIEKGLLRVNSDPGKHADIHTPLPSLNGDGAAFRQIVKDSPGLLPVQIANKFQHATKRTISGAQAKALIAQGPPVYQFDEDEEL